MKIKSIRLKNFQAHAEMEVAFSPTITTIKGSTDRGKSAILRALRWLCLNDFAGNEFIKEGEKKTVVEITTTDGEIIRTKSTDGTVNTYELEGRVLKSFGQDVPADVATVLQLNPINFQGQHDAPFWFCETAGEVSRRLNAVIDLSIIDKAIGAIGTEVRQSQEKKAFCLERLEAAKRELESLDPQRRRVDQFKRLRKQEATVQKMEDQASQFAGLVDRIRDNRAKELEVKAEAGNRALEAMKRALFLQERIDGLVKLGRAITGVPSLKHPPSIEPLTKQFESLSASHEKAEGLRQMVVRCLSAEAQVIMKEEERRQAEARFHKTIKGARCPLCNGRMG